MATYLLIVTTRLNSVDPRAWLADVRARIGDYPLPEATRSRLGTEHADPMSEQPPERCAVAFMAQGPTTTPAVVEALKAQATENT